MKLKLSRGFTLIELLIVIAVLGILVVAILSALDPLEQLRKARDAGRKSDAAELLAAYERYYTTYNCYPWDTGAPTCTAVVNRAVAVNPNFAVAGDDYRLITQGEMKAQFANRRTVIATTPAAERLFVSEIAATRQASVCFEPESGSARNAGAQGPLRTNTNAPDADNLCTGTYPNASCFICVPQ
ncbi:MAG: hypothetical protein A2786_02260 [Candidatus Chisholmbacteria bacterium RIFCSPHIGHO2_01_FULL_52_32]|uniref:Type II secretion system protein GspG C-terminal domain-containing protein n=1 Tax=Candidatus Chisholmbacteria bacterium RIFCSPHIGHO2_01_FULL_52_32 TaxID=1797591 RepID=A0A1G1VSD2_9BACT|nr:MAG: hypothetical protein A2786_02260 [Candidatus Chisholmbacteria bacterium RIFCSPHIGHO2_01_FULL_52_32]